MSEAFELLATVRLLVDLPDHGLRAGTTGTVVDLLDGSGTAYEVEVVDEGGRTLFLGALRREQIAPDGPPPTT
jgi:hypothetical protein